MKSSSLMLALILTALPVAVQAPSPQEQLWQHRNLGKAFYENAATLTQAVEEFKKALDLAPDSPRERLNYGLALLRVGRVDEGVAILERVQKEAPEIPHTWFNLGVEYKKGQKLQEAIAQFQGMIQRVPQEAKSHYNLGILLRLTDKEAEAVRHFEEAARLEPNLAAPHFQLANLYRREGKADESRKQQEIFRELKRAQQNAPIAEDLEWSIYSEVLDDLESVSFQDAPTPKWQLEQSLIGEVDPRDAGLAVLDAQGDGAVDLLAWSSAGISLYDKGMQLVRDAGLQNLSGIRSAAVGDFDNDGRPDLCVLQESGPKLLHNEGGRFAPSPLTLPSGDFRFALWLDFDHDYDLDLFLLGADSKLLRNQGAAGFGDRSSAFPFVPGTALEAVAVDTTKDLDGTDLLVSYADGPGVLYKDRLGGKFEASRLALLPARAGQMRSLDVDNDGWTDVAFFSHDKQDWLLHNAEGNWKAERLPGSSRGFVFADLENRGTPDLVADARISRNQGNGRFASGIVPRGFRDSWAAAAADFDADGRVDLAWVSEDGQLIHAANRTPTENHWIRVAVQGVKNLKLAPGAEIEVKAGPLYQKRLYRGVPLHFGLGDRSRIDTVRIVWPNGLIQNETLPDVDQALSYEERQRLSGSCPMIFTWNGKGHQFITDVLGVAPLGAAAGDGEYFAVDHDEFVQIPGESLAVRDGVYDVRISEELREVSYFDQIRLIAVDHPAETRIFVNDKFVGPPYPEFRLYGVRQRIYPAAARDDKGRDVLDRIVRLDRKYPDGFERDLSGLAEPHSLELDFPPDAAGRDKAILVLTGWLDWADGSTFMKAAQEGKALRTPSLEALGNDGRWKTIIEDMGMPAGKPKTIVVDLSGKLGAFKSLRIRSNVCVYWDEIFMSHDVGRPQARLTDVALVDSELRYRGFSAANIDPQRKQPEAFDYEDLRAGSMWNQTPGRYTRFGAVDELLAQVDDRFVIMGAGDELRLRFAPSSLPPLPEGTRRDFLLFVDGWAKDGDLNTAHSKTVAPLPFHGMSAYPYPETESYPDDEVHREYLRKYNTRPALRQHPSQSPRAAACLGIPPEMEDGPGKP